MLIQVALHKHNSSVWYFMGLLMAQYEGLKLGYAHSPYVQSQGATAVLDGFAFSMLNGMGDLFDIKPAVDTLQRPDFHRMSYHEVKVFLRSSEWL